MSVNIENPGKRDIDIALQNIVGAACTLEMISLFIQSGEFDMGKYYWHVGEALETVQRNLGDSYCVLNSNEIKITPAEIAP